MNTQKLTTIKPSVSDEQKRKIEEAQKSIDKLRSELAPFIKKRKFMEYTLDEQWENTYHFDVIG